MNPILNIQNQQFELLPQRAMFWIEQKALLFSDVHLGKATHFRRNGFAIPDSAGRKDIDNIIKLIHQTQAQQVFILGDLFHSLHNKEWDWFIDFLAKFPMVQFFLIRGNHDILPAFHMRANNLKVIHKIVLENICLIHEPIGNENEYVIAGHIHPGVMLKGAGKQRLLLPCFVVGSSRIILPAFGRLTGLARTKPLPNDQFWVIAENEVILIP
jgi:DNA ligase-associated metallophosphoesterase